MANRTLSSYVPGKKKVTHESCLVRGYWGDIIISPYISFGVECDVEPEKTKLFKVANKYFFLMNIIILLNKILL
jgi:dynein assembly factor 3